MGTYSNFRFSLLPVRCTMGGGPAGCFSVLGHHQRAVDEGLEQNLDWKDIFKRIGVTNRCCQLSISSMSYYYHDNDFKEEYSRNKQGSDDNSVWSLKYGNKASYPIHTRVYRLDALQGPVFVGYGSQMAKSVKDLEEHEENDIIIDCKQLEEDQLLEKHIEAIKSVEMLPSFSRHR